MGRHSGEDKSNDLINSGDALSIALNGGFLVNGKRLAVIFCIV